jgi:hypothetical protein
MKATRMLKKLAIIIVFVLVVCTVAGCSTTNNTNQTPSATSNATSSAAPSTATPTPTVTTPTPATDYSSYFNIYWTGRGMILERTFTKDKDDDVYFGIFSNTSLSSRSNIAIFEELTKSKDEAKKVFDKYVAEHVGEVTPRPDLAASMTFGVNYDESWAGYKEDKLYLYSYYYNPYVNSWDVTFILILYPNNV